MDVIPRCIHFVTNAVAILREAGQKKVTAGKGPVGIAAAAI
jgi:transcription initiation factor TFIIIB Brf1 subunit/transcription initiation factor TFIIB